MRSTKHELAQKSYVQHSKCLKLDMKRHKNVIYNLNTCVKTKITKRKHIFCLFFLYLNWNRWLHVNINTYIYWLDFVLNRFFALNTYLYCLDVHRYHIICVVNLSIMEPKNLNSLFFLLAITINFKFQWIPAN